MNPKLADAIARRERSSVVPRYQAFNGASLEGLVRALNTYQGGCELRIHSTLREDGTPDAWWEVVPKAQSAEGGDPPAGNESFPCPPFCEPGGP